jgi:hypothetical protein
MDQMSAFIRINVLSFKDQRLIFYRSMSDLSWISFSYFLAENNPLKGISDIESHYFLIIKIYHMKAFCDKGQ